METACTVVESSFPSSSCSKSCRDCSSGRFERLDRLPVHAGPALAGPDRFVGLVHSRLSILKRLACRIRRRHPVTSCLARYDHLIRPLRSSPITAPSSLLRVGPPQLPLGTLASRWCAACASPLASGSWFLQFRAKACIQLTPPLRRPPSIRNQAPDRLIPGSGYAPGFGSILIVYDASSKGSLSFVFRTLTYPGL